MSEVKVNKITPTTNCGTVTLGDSGDTVAIPCGVTLSNSGSITNSGTITNTGTISGGTITGTIDNQVNWDTTAKTANFTAVAGNGYFVNTTSGAITVTLPATPSAGDLVGIKDYANTADTNNITIARNGEPIQGTEANFTISTEGLSIILIYVDGTQGWVSTGSAQASNITSPQFIVATGGTITTCGDYKIHTFTGPGTFCVSSLSCTPANNSVDYLVVAGGASGGFGDIAGGGGAGGFRLSNSTCMPAPLTSPLANPTGITVTATSFPITVGGGGSPVATGSPSPGIGNSGSNSSFSTITSTGGGGGGGDGIPFAPGQPGGSGGGASYRCGTGGSGNTPPVSPPQGNNGGNSSPTPGGPAFGQGGGGGAGSVGANGTTSAGGDGGDGSYIVASGFGGCNGTPGTVCGARYFAGGGGSSVESCSGTPGGTGGEGGGGNGFTASPTNTNATAGTANTGGGGGGGEKSGTNYASGAGGSGIVIIRYKYQ